MKKTSFHKWLMNQMDRRDAVGDLSRDVQTDHRLDQLTFTGIKRALLTRPQWMKDACEQAGHEFEDYKKQLELKI